MLSTAALFAAVIGLAACNNVTVDDADLAHWSYTGKYGSFTAASPCSTCSVSPNPSDLVGGTWHDCSADCSMTVSFSGVAAYIFTVCPGPIQAGGSYRGNFSFLVDGKVPDSSAGYQSTGPTFLEVVGGCPTTQYNHSVFSVTGLPLGAHNVTIVNNSLNFTSDLTLDYAIIDDGTPQSASASIPAPTNTQGAASGSPASFPVAAVAVPVALVGALVLVIAIWLFRRRNGRPVGAAVRNDDGVLPKPYEPDYVARPYHAPPSISDGSTSPVMTTAQREEARAFAYPPQPADHDPELEAALAVIASRSPHTLSPVDEGPSSGGPALSPAPPRRKGSTPRAVRRTDEAASPPPPSYMDATSRR